MATYIKSKGEIVSEVSEFILNPMDRHIKVTLCTLSQSDVSKDFIGWLTKISYLKKSFRIEGYGLFDRFEIFKYDFIDCMPLSVEFVSLDNGRTKGFELKVDFRYDALYDFKHEQKKEPYMFGYGGLFDAFIRGLELVSVAVNFVISKAKALWKKI